MGIITVRNPKEGRLGTVYINIHSWGEARQLDTGSIQPWTVGRDHGSLQQFPVSTPSEVRVANHSRRVLLPQLSEMLFR